MVKPRKMLGDAASPQCQKLMRLIETQSKPTLALWALQLAEKRYLPIYTAAYPKDKRALQAIRICRECARNSGSVKEIKPLLKELIQLARDELAEPAVDCAVRAIATACNVLQTPTNALGFLFYGAAAVAYTAVGVTQSRAVYEHLAEEEFEHALAALQEAAIADEQHPVKVNWNC